MRVLQPSASLTIAAGIGAETPALASAASEASNRALGGLSSGGRGSPGYHGLSREDSGDDDGGAATSSCCAGGIEGAFLLLGGLPDALRAASGPSPARSLILFGECATLRVRADERGRARREEKRDFV